MSENDPDKLISIIGHPAVVTTEATRVGRTPHVQVV
jgi:hypothetical protein